MRRIFLYITALAFIGLAIAQQSRSPQPLERNSATETPDSAGGNIFVPVDTILAYNDSIVERNDTDFFSYDSIFSTTDSLTAFPDSLANDSSYRARRGTPLPPDSSRTVLSRINREKVDLDAAVVFDAKDSLVMLGQNNAYLYGEGKVEYGQFKLNSQEIRMELDKSTVYATGMTDSTGNLAGTPVFSDGGDEYESKEMTYNFKTERGFITDVITEQGKAISPAGLQKKWKTAPFLSRGENTPPATTMNTRTSISMSPKGR